MASIFVVEPYPDTQRTLDHVLTDFGDHDVRGSADAEIALRKILEWVQETPGPHLVVAEHLPGDCRSYTGGWLCEQLRLVELTREIPFILLQQGHGTLPRSRTRYLKRIATNRNHARDTYGVDEFIEKPFNPDLLLDAITGQLWRAAEELD